MKIDSVTLRPTHDNASKVTSRPTGSSPESTTAGGVRLSNVSAQLASASEPEVNAERVQQIRQAIAEGRFQINASAITDRLITTARELIHNHRGAT